MLCVNNDQLTNFTIPLEKARSSVTQIRLAMRSGCNFPSKRHLSTHSESWLVFARELALKGNLPTLNLTPAALSSSSFLPTQATSG